MQMYLSRLLCISTFLVLILTCGDLVNNEDFFVVEDNLDEDVAHQTLTTTAWTNLESTESDLNDQGLQANAPSECSTFGNVNFANIHYLLASTMDGKVTALDVNSEGETAWTVDADKAPLLTSTLDSQKFMSRGFPYMLVPSLDGSLYLLNVESSALTSIPMSADVSILIGDDEVAGGSFVSSTGVDPLTGEIRYRCTAGKCEQHDIVGSDSSPYTLIMRRNTQTARAADPFNGSERWNLSVGEYEISLVSSFQSVQYEALRPPSHIRFLMEPPTGMISAVDSCDNVLWKRQLSTPLARVWQLVQGQVFELSLFSSETVVPLRDFSGSKRTFIPKYEAPFYFGTVNSEPYIIPSESLRSELRRAAKSRQWSKGSLSSLRAHDVPFLEDLKVGDLIRRSYRTTMNAIEIDSVNGVPKPRTRLRESCYMDDAILVAGSRELQQVQENEEIHGDRGWYIFKPERRSCARPFAPWLSPDKTIIDCQQNPKCCKHDVLDGLKQMANAPVSGWWKLVALFSTMIAGLLGSLLFLYRHQICRKSCEVFLKRVITLHIESMSILRNQEALLRTPISSPRPFPQMNQQRNVSPAHDDKITSGLEEIISPPKNDSSFSSKFDEDFIPEKWLGRGGYGVVLNCRNRLDGRNYAVKRIAVINTVSAMERVTREVRAMALLDHPGIIRYFHTWLERPPAGWQQQKDMEIMSKVRCASEALKTSSSSSFEKLPFQTRASMSQKSKNESDDLSPVCPDFGVCDKEAVTDEMSWASNGPSNEGPHETSTSSSSDSDDDPKLVNPETDNSDDSSDVIFLHSGKTGDAENTSDPASHPLEPPAVLATRVSSLRACTFKNDYAYLYIQMELCKELTLYNWLQTNCTDTDRELEQMREWFAELVCAIEYIHGQGLIHRDLKPQNIFFSADDYLKIGDLGLATNHVKSEESVDYALGGIVNISHTGNVGTRLYMSPEQLKGREQYDEKIDIFSLGLVFVELIKPFKTVMERNYILSSFQKGVFPKELSCHPDEKNFIAWLTATNPKKRPSARQVAESDYLADKVSQLGKSYRRERTSSINCPTLC